MTVGLPGVGLGGIFYLLSAVLMPVREAVRLGRGSTAGRRRIVVRQSVLAAGILGSLWATGWLLGHLITAASHSRVGASLFVRQGATGNALRTSALLLSLGTLTLVLTTVQVTRIVVRLQRTRERSRGELAAPVIIETARSLRIDSGTSGRSR